MISSDLNLSFRSFKYIAHSLFEIWSAVFDTSIIFQAVICIFSIEEPMKVDCCFERINLAVYLIYTLTKKNSISWMLLVALVKNLFCSSLKQSFEHVFLWIECFGSTFDDFLNFGIHQYFII